MDFHRFLLFRKRGDRQNDRRHLLGPRTAKGTCGRLERDTARHQIVKKQDMPSAKILFPRIAVSIAHIAPARRGIFLRLLLTAAVPRKQGSARNTKPIGNRPRKISHMIEAVLALCLF